MTTASCVVCGKSRIRRPDSICSECAPGYYGYAARCAECGDPTRRRSRICDDCASIAALTPTWTRG